MNISKENSLTMGKRLKELRNANGFSHETLSNTIQSKYNVRISSDSLKNYEVSDKNHSRKYANEGMRAEYLRIFADLYDVSADYLLGLTDVKSPNPDIQTAVEITGLSEEAINSLRTLINAGKYQQNVEFINHLLSDPRFSYRLLNEIHRYCGRLLNYANAVVITKKEQESNSHLSEDEWLIGQINGTISRTFSVKELEELRDFKDISHLKVQRSFDNVLDCIRYHYCLDRGCDLNDIGIENYR